jgi:preprotein translocase subunit Sec63
VFSPNTYVKGPIWAMNRNAIDRALELFGLSEPVTRERLDAKRRELLATWHPHRYANLTNNPRKYMQMYQKGEAKTREVQEAYRVLTEWVASGERSST